jgi:hypothetical protein
VARFSMHSLHAKSRMGDAHPTVGSMPLPYTATT